MSPTWNKTTVHKATLLGLWGRHTRFKLAGSGGFKQQFHTHAHTRAGEADERHTHSDERRRQRDLGRGTARNIRRPFPTNASSSPHTFSGRHWVRSLSLFVLNLASILQRNGPSVFCFSEF